MNCIFELEKSLGYLKKSTKPSVITIQWAPEKVLVKKFKGVLGWVDHGLDEPPNGFNQWHDVI